MREIKFRAWMQVDEDGQESDEGTWQMVDDLAFEEYYPLNDQLAGVERLMQFTGLKDKNGVEIYEGDICKNGDYVSDAHAYDYRIEVISYIDDEAMFSGWNFNIDGMTCEVIGNIHENPKLKDTPC